MKSLTAIFLSFLLVAPPTWAADEKPRPVLSQNPVRLAVIDLSVPESLLARRPELKSALIRAFGSDRRVQLIPMEQVETWRLKQKDAEREPTPSEQLHKGRDYLAKGKRAYQSLKMKEAVTQLSQARREFILNLPALRSNRDLLDAHLYLGMTYVALKQSDNALEEFRRVVYLDPTRELRSREYSPQVIESFTKARRDVMAAEPIHVSLESSPQAGRIFLNGRSVGTTPTKITLQPGEYFVLIEKDGMKPWYQPVRFEKRNETLRASFQPLTGAQQWAEQFRVREGAELESGDAEFLKNAAGGLGVDLLFLGTLLQAKNYRFLGQLFDARTAEYSQVAVVAMGDDLDEFPEASKDLSQTLFGFIRPDGYLMTTKMSPTSDQASPLTVGGEEPAKDQLALSAAPKKKWYENWWVYPIIAGVVAGVVIGATQLGGSGSSTIVIDNRGNL